MAISRSSKSWNAFMLAAADDDQTINILGPALGVIPHFTVIEPTTKADFHIWETQAKYYKDALSEKSTFKFVVSRQLHNQKYQQLSVVAKQNIKKGTLISGLVGATYRIEPEYIIEGENDYSLIYSSRVNSDMLFLGPAAFCNHSCNPNCTLKCIVKKETGVLAVKNIKANEEITVFYGQNYFENNNELCNCVACISIRLESSTYASETNITHATPESEIDNTFFGQPSENYIQNEDVNVQKAPDSMLCDTTVDKQSPPPPPGHNLQDQPSGNCNNNMVVNAQKAPDSMLCDTDLDEQSPPPPDHKLQDQPSENCNHNEVVNAQKPDSTMDVVSRKKKKKIVCTVVRSTDKEPLKLVFNRKEAECDSDSSDIIGDESSDEFDNDCKKDDDDDEDNVDEDDDDDKKKTKKNYPCTKCGLTFAYKSWLKRLYCNMIVDHA